MARISQVSTKNQQEFYFISIRKTINFMEEYAEFTGDSFNRISDYLSHLGVLVSDGPIVCFHNTDLKKLDIEAGFPAVSYVEGKADILITEVPAQMVVTAIDLGPYEKQDTTLQDLFSFIHQNEYEALGTIYYQYLNDTNRPEGEYLTKMMIPVNIKVPV